MSLKTLEKRPKEEHSTYWTAEARIFNSGTWGVNISLYNILPREGIEFLVEGKCETIEVGNVLYFYINWLDDGKRESKCSIFNVLVNPPEATKYTFWTGVVTQVKTGPIVTLEDITPPYNTIFKLGSDAIPVLKNNGKNARICFLPYRCKHEWELTNVSLRGKKRIYINMDALLIEPVSDVVEVIGKLAERNDVFIITAASKERFSALNDKVSWVSDNLGVDYIDKLIVCNHNDLLKGDYLIDLYTEEAVVLFDGVWIPIGNERFPGWDEVRHYLTEEED